MFDEAERKEFWAIFRGSPLFTGWKDVERDLSPRLERVDLSAGQPVFSAGEGADCLYLVAQGAVVQTIRHEGVEWLRRRYGPGDYFGQHALFSGRHLSTAIAEAGTLLYKMPAGDLRAAMERNAELYEVLLQERRASRLRAMPIFRALSDAQVRRVALLVEEVELDGGAAVPLDGKRGLWMIDFGQVTVTGAASFGRPGWRLSAGNFFVSSDVVRAAQCAANEATAYLRSRLLYLSTEHFNRLLTAFSDMRRLTAEPLDIADVLADVDLFQQEGVTAAHRQHLAQFCGWGFVPDQQNITTQGALGHSFVIIRDGLALVTNFDEQGRTRPMNYIRPGGSYGETSLLSGKPRDVTVRGAVAPAHGARPGLRGADVLTLDRRDLQAAFADRPDLWDNKIGLVKRFSWVKVVKRRYGWQAEDEQIIWDGRGHFFWLMFPAAAPILLLLMLLALIWAISLPLRGVVLVTGILLLGALVAAETWFIVNYFDDYYAVTSQRVTRYDRQLLALSETQMEAPITMVQDVTIQSGFWGRFFDWGDVTIRTAAKIGEIVFAHVPQPEEVKRHILEERAHAQAMARGQQKETLRRTLIAQLRVALPIPERQRALGSEAPTPPTGSIVRWWRRWLGRRRPRRGLPTLQAALPRRILRRLARPLPGRLRRALRLDAPPAAQPSTGEQYTWRKHPVALVKRIWWPFLGLVVLVLYLLPRLGQVAALLHTSAAALLPPWLFLAGVLVLVLWWQVADYLNDIYVLTDDKIMDIEMKPFGLDYKRREGSLERVQSVDFVRTGALAVVFDYGNVVIRTAAADEGYEFVMISNPKHVQEVVFQKLAALRQRQEAKAAADRQQELLAGLQVYNDLQDMIERSDAGSRF